MSDYIIDGEYARLKTVDEKTICKQCGKVLMLRCGGTVLIKTHVSLVTKKGFVLRCGGCKTFNVIEGNSHDIAV